MAFSFGASAPAAATTTKPATFSFGGSSSAAGTGTGTGGGGGGGLFSGFGQQQQQQQPAAAAPASSTGGASGFSFGGFGANKPTTTAATTTPAPAGGGLFGNLGSSNTTNTTGQQQNKPTFSFGNPAASTSTTTAPTLNFGASTSQPQQQQQQGFGQQNTNTALQNSTSQNGSATGSNNVITKSTKFEDLPEGARKMIEEIETYIQGRHAIYDSLSTPSPSPSSSSTGRLGSEIESTTLLLRSLSIEFSALSNHLQQDSRATQDLRARFEQSLRDAVKAVQIVDAVRAPGGTQQQQQQGQQQQGGIGQNLQNHNQHQQQQGGGGQQQGQGNRPHPAFLQEFFHRKAEDLHRRLTLYKSSLSVIQSQLSSLSPSSSLSSSVQSILPTLRSQHHATLQCAARLSTLEASAGELKDEYRALWRERTGSVRDPFEERRREVLGYSGDPDKALEAMAGGMAIR